MMAEAVALHKGDRFDLIEPISGDDATVTPVIVESITGVGETMNGLQCIDITLRDEEYGDLIILRKRTK